MILNGYSIRAFIIVGIVCLATGAYASDYSADLTLGYNGGTGFQLDGMAADFAEGFPFSIQLGIAYSRLDPGDAADARRIFINDATNGDPEEKGWMWNFKLDFLHRLKWFSSQNINIYGGPRHSRFKGNFKFIGGNEDFDITSNQWGVGFGMKTFFPMSSKLDFVLTGGFDYYFSSDLRGHDTTYNPDGENINARNNYDYDNADEAINQPRFPLLLMLGVNYRF